MRLAKRVPIRERMGVQVLIESFNTQNRVNFTGVSTVWGTDLLPRSTLGQKTSAGDPRQIQLGVKFEY
jgi:hypothetical protein